MAITQDRMLALIADTEEAEQQFEDLKQALQRITAYQAKGLFTQDEAWAAVLTLVEKLPRKLPLLALAVEKTHFAKTAKANERAKRYAAGQRRLQGVPPRGVTALPPAQAPAQMPAPYQPTRHNALPFDPAEPLAQAPPKAAEKVTLDPEYLRFLKAQEKLLAEKDAEQAQAPPPQDAVYQPRSYDMGGGRVADLSEIESNILTDDPALFLPTGASARTGTSTGTGTKTEDLP